MSAIEVEVKREGKSLKIVCPFCGKVHSHGAAVLGHRVAHCDPTQARSVTRAGVTYHARDGYILVEAKGGAVDSH